MTRTVYAKWLCDSRRSLLGWTVAIVVVGCGYAAFWPTFEDPEISALLDSYPSALLEAINYTNITTPAGYLGATVYGLVVAVLMAVFAIGAGARLIAGEEEAGTLDLTLSHPVSRPSLALQRVAALVTAVLGVVVVFWLAMLALSGPARFSSVGAWHLAAMHVHLAAFALLFGCLAFAVGAATGRRSWAVGAGAAAAVVAYAASGILPQVDGLEWTRDWSAFTWLVGSAPLENGIDPAHLGILVGLSALLVAAGTLVFRRRDVAV
ncbi:MAG: ABC transporter permease subunit [Ornithinibacter sp.]